MVNLDNIVNKNNKNNDKDWPFRMLIIGPSGSRKTNTLLHLIQKLNNTKLIDKIIVFDDMIADIIFNPLLKNYLLDVENRIFLLYLLHNLILELLKMQD